MEKPDAQCWAALRSTVDPRTERHWSFAGVQARRRCKGTELATAAEKDRGDLASPYRGLC